MAAEIASHSEPRIVWHTPPRNSGLFPANYAMVRNVSSLDALGAIAIEARSRPGRKLLLWLSPGWPVNAGGKDSFEELVEYSTRLREARLSLWVCENPNGGAPVKEVRDQTEAGPSDLAPDVLATKSGGGVLAKGSTIRDLFDRSLKDASNYYTLTFDPPVAVLANEYHALEVRVNKADVQVRTNTEYYDQPTFYDVPALPRTRVSAAQLPQELENLRSLSDAEAARRLAAIELADRLNRTALAEIKPLVRGEKASEEFTLLADNAEFLPSPVEDSSSIPAPDRHDQRLMLDRTLHYAGETMLALPNFIATRTTIGYQEAAQKQDQSWKTSAPDRSLHAAKKESVNVLIQNSKETTEAATPAPRHSHGKESTLVTQGTFGPMLAMVLMDVAAPQSQMTWARWEQGSEGRRAVFRYAVPSGSGHFEVGFCCLALPDGTVPFNTTTGYHGEITIDPETGVVFRIVAEADLAPKLPMDRSDIVVEYGPVVVGGQTYICPLHSVSISRSRTVRLLHQWNMSFGVYGPFETILNDVTFSDYHRFRSNYRLLTDDSPVQ